MSVLRVGALTGLAMMTAFSNVSFFDINTISATGGTTGNLLENKRQDRLPRSPNDSCSFRIVEYFSKENLVEINTALGELKNWIDNHSYFDQDFVEDYLGDGWEENDSGIRGVVYGSYTNIMDYHAVYNPGTEHGLAYIQNPAAAVGAIFAYVDYADQLKHMMASVGNAADLAAFSTSFDPLLDRLRNIAERTDMAMDVQLKSGCFEVAQHSPVF